MFKNLSTTVKDVDQKGRVVVAANAFNNIDADKDISLPGSFDKTIKENFHRVKWFLNHDRTQLLGVPLEATPTAQYLQITGQLNLNKQIAKDIYEDYKLYAEYGKSLEHSIGVDPVKVMDDFENGVRKVSEWKLWEYSTLTSWGANEMTPLISMKSTDLQSDLNFLELKLKKGNYTDETCYQIEKSIMNIRSLLTKAAQPSQLKQPVPADVLAEGIKQFTNSLIQN